MRNGKLIQSITIKHLVDDDPDTSHLGAYSDTCTSEYSIDRRHTLECVVNQPAPIIAPHTLYECGICDSVHPWAFNSDCRDDTNRYADHKDYAERNNIPEDAVIIWPMDKRVDHDNGCDMGRAGHRFFNPSPNYVDANGNLIDGNTPEEVRKYVAEDYQRMETLQRGVWSYIGVMAEAELVIAGVCQRISSGGLWGIESDSDASYLVEVSAEQLSELRTILYDLGFSKRAIATACKNVKSEGTA